MPGRRHSPRRFVLQSYSNKSKGAPGLAFETWDPCNLSRHAVDRSPMETQPSLLSFVRRHQHFADTTEENTRMSSEFENAQEHLEHAAHEHGASHARAAIIIAIMAAALALTEFVAKDAQTGYLTNHIAASDTWAQYQAKSVRRTILTSEAELLQSLPTSNDPVVQKRIADVH